MYRRVIGLWGGGDPDLNPVVDHARARLDSLSRAEESMFSETCCHVRLLNGWIESDPLCAEPALH
jgi:hypothetical protein